MGISRAGERYGRRRIVSMLTGDTSGLPARLAGLSTTGSLRDEPREILDGWIHAAVASGLLIVSPDEYRTLSLTAKGQDVLAGRARGWHIPPPSRSSRRSVDRPFSRRRHVRMWERFSRDW